MQFSKIVSTELRDALRSNRAIGVHRDLNSRSVFAIGFVRAVSGDHVWLQEIDEGRDDGISCFALESVFMVRTGGPTVEAQELLAKENGNPFGTFEWSSFDGFLGALKEQQALGSC